MSVFKKETLKILVYATHIISRPIWVKKRFCGFTLIEVLTVIAILGTLSAIAIPLYSNQIEKARIVKAIAEIGIMQKEIALYDLDKKGLPITLDDIRRGNLLDPWGNPYEYLNFATVKKFHGARKDRHMKPLNSDYDLFSKGKDGDYNKNLNAKVSQDDVIRANDGRFIGLVSEY